MQSQNCSIAGIALTPWDRVIRWAKSSLNNPWKSLYYRSWFSQRPVTFLPALGKDGKAGPKYTGGVSRGLQGWPVSQGLPMLDTAVCS